MATFTNTSPDDLDVYVDGVSRLVDAGASFDVPEAFADGFRQQPAFAELVAAKPVFVAPVEVVTPVAPPAPAGRR